MAEPPLQSAVEACEARAGRALALDTRVFSSVTIGKVEGPAASALEAAEKLAFGPRPSVGRELMVGSEDAEEGRRAFSAHVEGANAIAVAMAARLGSSATPRYVGVVSIGRYGTGFTREEEELLEYLAGQAVVSIENASLHETVQRQAVTDELTGLANARELHAVLDREIERGRRFASPLGLVMLDIDNFKQVNDRYGHQQGDEVLAAVASVLRDYSRDIDEPARYGGEELAVVLPQTDSEGAARLAERMREAVERLRVSSAGSGKAGDHRQLRCGLDPRQRRRQGLPDSGGRRRALPGKAGRKEPRGARRPGADAGLNRLDRVPRRWVFSRTPSASTSSSSAGTARARRRSSGRNWRPWARRDGSSRPLPKRPRTTRTTPPEPEPEAEEPVAAEPEPELEPEPLAHEPPPEPLPEPEAATRIHESPIPDPALTDPRGPDFMEEEEPEEPEPEPRRDFDFD